MVATVLTVYGIETFKKYSGITRKYNVLQQYLPFTVLKQLKRQYRWISLKLQQYLPFTVLKRHLMTIKQLQALGELQQYLPFTVLKRYPR